MARPTSLPSPAPPRRLGVSLLALSLAAPCVADESRRLPAASAAADFVAIPAPDPAPGSLAAASAAASASAHAPLHAPPPAAAPAPSSRLGLRDSAPSFSFELKSPPISDRTAEGGPVLPHSRGERMRRAFLAEMREEAIKSRRASLYATIPLELPELLEDDYVRDQQARVARSVIGEAIEAAVFEGFFEGRSHRSSVTIRPLFAVAEHGIRIDASPSWSYRMKGPRSGWSLDVPMTPSALRLHAYRDLRGTNRTPFRLGGGVLLDAFDEEIRAGISLQF